MLAGDLRYDLRARTALVPSFAVRYSRPADRTMLRKPWSAASPAGCVKQQCHEYMRAAALRPIPLEQMMCSDS